MNETISTFSTGTLQAWLRLPKSVQLGAVILAAIAIGVLAAVVVNTPSAGPATAHAAVSSTPTTTPTTTPPTAMRDPSVPEASQALSTDDQLQGALTPTF